MAAVNSSSDNINNAADPMTPTNVNTGPGEPAEQELQCPLRRPRNVRPSDSLTPNLGPDSKYGVSMIRKILKNIYKNQNTWRCFKGFLVLLVAVKIVHAFDLFPFSNQNCDSFFDLRLSNLKEYFKLG